MAIKVIIDSASDISKIEAEQKGISMLSMEVTFGDEVFFDGDEILPSEFYKKLETCDKLPTTSLINSYRWEEAFKDLTKNGDDVIAIVISAKLSGTYQAALTASQNFNGKVHVIDSNNVAVGERILCDYALKLIEEGKSINEIVEELNKKKNDICIFAVVDTLKYIKKGGRISAAVAFAGELLGIKPVLQLIDGEVKLVGKALGLKKAFLALNNKVNDCGGIDFTMPYGAFWSGGSSENLDKYISLNSEFIGDKDKISKYILGGTIGTHVGPGVMGLSFFKKK